MSEILERAGRHEGRFDDRGAVVERARPLGVEHSTDCPSGQPDAAFLSAERRPPTSAEARMTAVAKHDRSLTMVPVLRSGRPGRAPMIAQRSYG